MSLHRGAVRDPVHLDRPPGAIAVLPFASLQANAAG